MLDKPVEEIKGKGPLSSQPQHLVKEPESKGIVTVNRGNGLGIKEQTTADTHKKAVGNPPEDHEGDNECPPHDKRWARWVVLYHQITTCT